MTLRSRSTALLLAATTLTAHLPGLLGGAIAVAALAPAALANTWIVDQLGGPGSHFTDLPPAITAASAGDVLIVRPGSYSPYLLDKGLTIVGDSTGSTFIRILPGIFPKIRTIPQGQIAIVSRIKHDSLDVSSCSGAVVLDHLHAAVFVNQCDDVRIASLGGFFNSVWVDESHVEIVSSDLRGFNGLSENGDDGYPALDAQGSSRVLFARSSASGGHGGSGPNYFPGDGGDGGPGVMVYGHSEVWIAGGGVATIEGGPGGWAGGGTGGSNGWPGSGLANYASGDWRSGATFVGGAGVPPIHYVPGPGSFDIPITPDDPTLELIGDPRPGASVTLKAYAPPGSIVRLTLGGSPVILPTPGVRIEQLTTRDRSIFLGVVPASGVVSHVLNVPPNYAPGARLFAQGRVVDYAIGEVRRTNSVPIIVH